MSDPSNAFVVMAPYIEQKFNSARWKTLDHGDENPKRISAFPKGQALFDKEGQPNARLRLDWEIATPAHDEMSWRNIKKLMVLQMSLDIADLIVNGDVAGTDPLLKTMDGEIKRGQRMIDFRFTEVQVFRHFAERKDTVEYTAYTVIYPVFE